MSQKFYEMQAEVREASKPKPPNEVIFLVAAYREPQGKDEGYWKIFRESSIDEFHTAEFAQKRADALGSGWTHRKIIRIEFREEQ